MKTLLIVVVLLLSSCNWKITTGPNRPDEPAYLGQMGSALRTTMAIYNPVRDTRTAYAEIDSARWRYYGTANDWNPIGFSRSDSTFVLTLYWNSQQDTSYSLHASMSDYGDTIRFSGELYRVIPLMPLVDVGSFYGVLLFDEP